MELPRLLNKSGLHSRSVRRGSYWHDHVLLLLSSDEYHVAHEFVRRARSSQIKRGPSRLVGPSDVFCRKR